MAFWKQPPSPIEATITTAQARIVRILFLRDVTLPYHAAAYPSVSLLQYLTKSLLRRCHRSDSLARRDLVSRTTEF
jgi:hypothetical protein